MNATPPIYPLPLEGTRSPRLSRELRLAKSELAIPRLMVLPFLWTTMTVVAVLAFFALPASAATITPVGTRYTVNATPGADHTDPHIDGNQIAYTTAAAGASSIHSYDLSTATDTTIPNAGGFDFLSSISAGRIALSRSILGTNGGIWLYDTSNTTSPGPIPISAQPGSAKDSVDIGGNTVVWQDRTANPNPQIVVYDLTTGTTTQLTNDSALFSNLTPEVSSDGTVITWIKCNPDNTTGCNVYDATLANGSWTVRQLSSDGADSHPDTNGSVVVYASGIVGSSSHLEVQPVAGGPAQQLATAGSPGFPSIGGNYVSYANVASDYAVIHVAELRNGSWDGNIYQITNPPEVAFLSDITFTPSGPVTVTWQAKESGQFNVYAFRFTPNRPTPESVCTQTVQDVQGSDKYKALPAWLRGPIDRHVGSLCTALAAITANLTPAQKRAVIDAYKYAVTQLAAQGWLTSGQASDLAAEADLL